MVGKKYLILDDVPFHKKHEILQIVKSFQHSLIFILHYSLFLNPKKTFLPKLNIMEGAIGQIKKFTAS